MNSRCPIIFLLSGLLLLGSCKKYLDVQPETSYTETQVYNNEAALQQAFNGLYLDLASSELYGSYLSSSMIELMAQRYKPVSDLMGTRELSSLVYYDYGAPHIQRLMDTIWRKAYATVLATNVFLSKIDNSIAGNVVSQPNGKLLKGEALAIRAMLHFDMLRLFGPVYSSGSGSTAIPYYSIADGKMQPLLTASQAMEKIMADLTEAANLLAADPVITNGIVYTSNFYSAARNQRLNYYAVRSLMARAYIWQGKTTEAYNTALSIITDGEKWFPWTTPDAVNNPTNPDRVFSPEIIFGANNAFLYNNYDRYFNPALWDGSILVPDATRFSEVFEGLFQDYRVVQTWLTGNGKAYRTFYKYAPLAQTQNWRFIQPLIRKSELYLILAETETDPVKALGYLNTERRNRGLANLASISSMAAELRKEYQKEFWGEGQLFFYYKRINATGVPSASMPYPWATVDPVYTVPLPLSETSTR
jgi:hypothetical protein